MKLFRLNEAYEAVPEQDTIMLVPEFAALWKVKYNISDKDYRGSDRKLRINYDKDLFDVEYETHVLEDRKLLSSWDKGELYQIVFTMKNKNLSGKIKWTIKLI